MFVLLSEYRRIVTYLTYALSLPVEHRPQTTYLSCLHPTLSCAAASIFLQLYLEPAVPIFTSYHIVNQNDLYVCIGYAYDIDVVGGFS